MTQIGGGREGRSSEVLEETEQVGYSPTETRTEIDEVTGLEYPVTENKYVLGVELLGATLAVSGGLFGLSLAFRNPTRPDKQPGAETSSTQL